MSLLMEALRKAEEAKRRAQDKEKAEAGAAATEPARTDELQPADFPPPETDTDSDDNGPANQPVASFEIVDPPPKLTRESAGYLDAEDSTTTQDQAQDTESAEDGKHPDNKRKSERPAAFREPVRKQTSSADLDGYFTGPPDMDDSYPPPADIPPGVETDRGPSGDEAPDTGGNLNRYLAESPDLDDAYPPPSTAHHVEVSSEREKLAAASIFAAKRTAAPQKSNRKMTIVLGVMLALIIPVGGGVFWYITSQTSSSLVNPALRNFDSANRTLGDTVAESALPDAVEAADDVSDPGLDPVSARIDDAASFALQENPADDDGGSAVAQPAAALTADLASTTEAETDSAEIPASGEMAQATMNQPIQSATAGNPPEEDDATATPPVSASGNTLVVSRTNSSRRINPTLQNAYGMLQSGDLLAAQQLYEEVLTDNPNSRDALLGVASVYSSQGNTNGARAIYSRLLQLNPQDPLARTGLLQTVQTANPADQESQHRNLMNQFPDVAPLTFALGNFLAGQRRWAEAQESYFNALLQARRAGGPVSPDYAFNLAVSLEQLGQRASALEYYRQARALMQQSKPGFDPGLLAQRLSLLQGDRP
jgi:Tfp pilus assembly protein PilF